MQKKIIALAIASALTAPALALADTTIYGVLDAGYAQTKAEVSGPGGGTGELDAFGFSTMTSSRLGFMHTEDLNGGMKVMGKVETGIGGNVMGSYTQGSSLDGTAPSATTLGNRELNASLMFNQGTTVKVGLGSTLIRDISLGYAPDPGGNLVGNILNNNADFSSNRATGLTVTQGMDKASVAVQLTKKTAKVTGNGDLKSGNGWLVGGQYADGPMGVAAAYQRAETSGNDPFGVQNSDVTKKIWILAGSFDLGAAKLLAEYGDAKSDQSVGASPTAPTKANGLSIGVQAPFGDIMGFVQLSRGKHNYDTRTAEGDLTQSGYTIGGKYNFSKTSYDYLSFGQNKVNGGSINAERKVNQVAIGMVHTF